MASLTTCIPLYLDADGTEVLSAFLRYDGTEMPFHVCMRVPHNPDTLEFYVFRDFIAAGLNRTCLPDNCSCQGICLQRDSAGWLQAVFQFPGADPLHSWILRQDLENFLVRTYEMTPWGAEFSNYDWDNARRRLNPE
ncbi:hypothetical protein AB0I81_43620 [Nonomuraea sp. NPDC050404]|uniref:hypothetical protein n=1 Tax=Nonomuraea sp. NPDC050404 TaxID=3155783 RepID=UPI0033FA1281